MAAAPSLPIRTDETRGGVYFEVHGEPHLDAERVPLVLGFPMMASHAQIFGAEAGRMRDEFLRRLVAHRRVVLVDYPSIGRSVTIPPEGLTIARACEDMLAVADAAGIERFSWWGATFGAVIGMALAAQSDRVAALVSSGWPPLGMPYAELVEAGRAQLADPPPHARVVLRTLAQYAQWMAFYASLGDDWDTETVPRIRCPRLLVYGERADSSVGALALPLPDIIRQRRAALETLGWRVIEVAGADSSLLFDAAALVPIVCAFFDSASSESRIIKGTTP